MIRRPPTSTLFPPPPLSRSPQWSDKATPRAPPCLPGLFSIVALLAARLDHRTRLRVSAAAWYRKKRPTFSDALAAARREGRKSTPPESRDAHTSRGVLCLRKKK